MRALPIVAAVAAFVLGGVLVGVLTSGPEAPVAPAPTGGVAPEPTAPADGPRLRIAILDFSRIHQQSRAIESLDTAYRAAILAYAEETKAREAELRAEEDALRRREAEMSAEDYRRERALLQRRMTHAMEQVQERKRTLDLARQEGLNRVQLALNDIVYEIATEQRLSIILRKEQTVLVAVDLEITDEVLRRLNDRLASVDVFAPEN